jgi:hypothetical protein
LGFLLCGSSSEMVEAVEVDEGGEDDVSEDGDDGLDCVDEVWVRGSADMVLLEVGGVEDG